MAPTLLAARAKSQDSGNGLSITSAAVKKGRPTVVKYSWQFHDNSPKFFAGGIVDAASKEFILLEDDVETRGHGKNGKGTDTVSIDVLKNSPGKYVLVLVDTDDYDIVFATSKAFQVKKSDF
ncbi:hypothetical protein M407DRAFT_17725 [Tulasnella calospora MUT 4182]|uniref:Uncharacterized protein n=1 Tax=Tulasnella calospora MUT 4182 TaxID=1051891 RepID=A0A0C3QWX9_9AGAM|nr:hypothetical protein M407DRAFT_17725 [Tulasnella calospora MUT 4182]